MEIISFLWNIIIQEYTELCHGSVGTSFWQLCYGKWFGDTGTLAHNLVDLSIPWLHRLLLQNSHYILVKTSLNLRIPNVLARECGASIFVIVTSWDFTQNLESCASLRPATQKSFQEFGAHPPLSAAKLYSERPAKAGPLCNTACTRRTLRHAEPSWWAPASFVPRSFKVAGHPLEVIE